MTRPDDAQRVSNLLFYGALILVAYLGYQIVQPFLVQIAWALVLAICLAPAQTRLARRIGSLRASAFLTLMVLVLLFVPALAVVGALLRQGSTVVDYVHQQLVDRGGPMGLFHVVWDWLHERGHEQQHQHQERQERRRPQRADAAREPRLRRR